MLSHPLTFTANAAIALSVLGLAGHATASTIRDDRSASQYRELANDFPFVGTNSGNFYCSGTLIAPDVFLTAAHCGTPTSVRIGGGTYAVAQRTVHPRYNGNLLRGFDFQILKLATPVLNVTPAPLYTDQDELGQLGYSVGFGSTGNGLTGVTGSAGTKQAFTNMIDVTGSVFGSASNSGVLVMDFDDPRDLTVSTFGSAIATQLEGQIASGDSGGGLFILKDGQYHLAGVTSFSIDFPSDDGITANYGDQSGYARVSESLNFILPFIPEPSTPLGLGALGLTLLQRQNRRHEGRPIQK